MNGLLADIFIAPGKTTKLIHMQSMATTLGERVLATNDYKISLIRVNKM